MNYTEKHVKRFWAKVDRSGGDNACWIWKGHRNHKNYGIAHWNKKTERAHRVAWILSYGEIPGGLWVLHKCDNPTCVNPKHLFLGTSQDNVNDRTRKNHSAHNAWFGEKNPACKLSDKQVAEIRQRYAGGKESQNKLAKAFQVSQGLVWRIIHHLIRN